MASKIPKTPSFDAKVFLGNVGDGRSIASYRAKQPICPQAMPPMRYSSSRKAK